MSEPGGFDRPAPTHPLWILAGVCLALMTMTAIIGGTAIWVFGRGNLGSIASRYPDSCQASQTALVRAASQGQIDQVRAALAHQADPNTIDAHGYTALWCGVEGGNAATVDAMLAAGANPNLAGDGPDGGCLDLDHDLPGQPANSSPEGCDLPVARAVSMDRPDLVSLLLDHRADPTAGLYLASMKHDMALTRLLLDRGADPNGSGGTTPLLYDVVFANHDLVDLLLEHGADADLGGPSQARVVQLAPGLLSNSSTASEAAALRLLTCGLAGAAPNLPPLVVAAALGDVDSTEALLAHHADPNLVVGFEPPVSPLQAATATNQSSLVARLVAAGAHAPPVAVPSRSIPASGVC